MTTTAIETLSERAIATAKAAAEENERANAAARVEAMEAERNLLREFLKSMADLEEGDGYTIVDTPGFPVARTPDGLVFRFSRTRNYSEFGRYYHEVLYLERTCAKCGESMLVKVWDDYDSGSALRALGFVLQRESFQHDGGCPSDAESIAAEEAKIVVPPETLEDRLAKVVREVIRDELIVLGVGFGE